MVQWVTALKISSLNWDYILRKNIMVIKIYNKSKLLKEISFSKGKICYILVNPPPSPCPMRNYSSSVSKQIQQDFGIRDRGIRCSRPACMRLYLMKEGGESKKRSILNLSKNTINYKFHLPFKKNDSNEKFYI